MSKDSDLSKAAKWKKEFLSLGMIILVVMMFRSVFFEPFKIPSGSMIPTLMIGDFILVNKFAYGLKVPYSDWFEHPIYITGPHKPKRGDVVVFKYPKDPSLNYIKRNIALPGETIEIKDKVVHINGEPLPQKEKDGALIMKDMDDKFRGYNLKFFDNKTGDHEHVTQTNEDSFYNSYFPPVTIPQENYFVMGDNRDFSADSRFWKFVPFGNIKGQAVMVWFSMIFPWPGSGDGFKFRPHRIGNLIK